METVRNILFGIFICAGMGLSAQQRIVDSLEIELSQKDIQSMGRLTLLNQVAYYYAFLDTDKGMHHADEAIKEAQLKNDSLQWAMGYSRKALNYSQAGQDSIALRFYGQAQDMYKQLGNDFEQAKIAYNLSLIYFNQAAYRKANEQIGAAFVVFEERKDSFLMAKMKNSIGINHLYLSEYPESFSAFNDALLLYDQLGKTKDVEYGSILSNLGLLYEKFDNDTLALAYQEKALIIFKEVGYEQAIANVYTNRGNLYRNLDKYPDAIDDYKVAYEIMNRIGNIKGEANALTNIGVSYASLQAYDKALDYLEKPLIIYKDLGDINNLASAHQSIGDIYYTTGSLDKAIDHLEESVRLAQQSESIRIESNAWKSLSTVFFDKTNYKEAFLAKEKAEELQEIFLSSEKKETIAKLEAKYEYEKEKAILEASYEKEKALNLANIDKQVVLRNSSILIGSCVVLGFIVVFILFKRKRDAEIRSKDAAMNEQVAISKLRLFRSQMNPHFIFNSLNSIKDYIHKNKQDVASDYLTQFAIVMRKTLENSQEEWILLQDEIKFLKDYLHLEQNRLENRFSYHLKVDELLEEDNTLIPPLLLQPFIENSIWHGFVDKKEGGLLHIDFYGKDDQLVCVVDDNGKGRKRPVSDYRKTSKSLGIAITQQRIDVLNRSKKNAANFRIIDKEQGIRVEIVIPLELAY